MNNIHLKLRSCHQQMLQQKYSTGLQAGRSVVRLSKTSSPSLGPTGLLFNKYTALLPGGKAAGREFSQCPATSAEDKTEWSHTSTSWRAQRQYMSEYSSGATCQLVCARIAQSVWRLGTGSKFRGSNPGGDTIFSSRPGWPWGPPASYRMDTGCLSRG